MWLFMSYRYNYREVPLREIMNIEGVIYSLSIPRSGGDWVSPDLCSMSTMYAIFSKFKD